MEYFDKKITYLRGLCDGSGFDPDTKEGKIFHGIMDILEDMAFMLETFLDDEELEEMELDEEETEEPVYFYSFICPNCGEEIDVDEEPWKPRRKLPVPLAATAFPWALWISMN